MVIVGHVGLRDYRFDFERSSCNGAVVELSEYVDSCHLVGQ